MKQITIGLVLITALVNTASAFTIHNGRILQNREWTTGNKNIRVVERVAKEQNTPAQSHSKRIKQSNTNVSNKDFIELHNRMFNRHETSVVGVDTEIAGSVNVYIENFNSTVPKTYNIYSNFCLLGTCTNSSYDIQLDPGGWFEMKVVRALTYNFDTPGFYSTTLTTVVDGDDLTNGFATSADGYVEVTP